MAVYTQIDNPELYFQCKLYTGTGSSQSITLDGDEDMQPDLVWIKQRSATEDHNVTDSVRGATKTINPNATTTEGTYSSVVSAFGSDGFTVGTSDWVNKSSSTYVAWNWKENNSDAGVDIVSYTGTGSNTTVSHGLSAVPNMIIVKDRDGARDWTVYHKSVGNGKWLQLNDTSAQQTGSQMWQDTDPTSSVFSIGTYAQVNTSSSKYIAYCFAEKQGFSKFGSYVGNANDNGPFIYCGFRPAWIMCKASSDSGEGWHILDNKRDIDNPVLTKLAANATSADSATAGDNNVDFLSNGFKIITNDNGLNKSGVTFIFAAFAEAPFVNSNGVPCNAR